MSPADLALPEALPLLLLPPAVWAVLVALARRRHRRLRDVVGPRLAALAPDAGAARGRHALFAGGLALAVVAMLQPLGRHGERHGAVRGVDLVLALDVSRSMLARDMEPDRLRAATAQIERLARRLEIDRLGLVAFAGEARVATPLTRDPAAVLEMLQGVDPWFVTRGGTDLGAAVLTAAELLDPGSGAPGVVILLTDGEDLGGRGQEAAGAARDRGVVVHCVGYGSVRGSKIPEEGGGFVTDAGGLEVVSRLEPESLRRLAAAGGGAFVEAALRERPLLDLYEDRIVPLARQAVASDERRGRANLYQWPLVLGLLLLLLELGWPTAAGRRP